MSSVLCKRTARKFESRKAILFTSSPHYPFLKTLKIELSQYTTTNYNWRSGDFSAAMGKQHKSLTESLVEQVKNGSALFEIVSANSFSNQLPPAFSPFACISSGPNAHLRDSLFFARVELPRRGTPPAMKKIEHYTVQKVRGDGRCMFRSLVKGMAANKGNSLSPREEVEDADELRMAVKDALCRSDKERRAYEEALIAITVEESLNRYCQRIQHPNFWGGESELLVLSKMCSQPIIVYIPEFEQLNLGHFQLLKSAPLASRSHLDKFLTTCNLGLKRRSNVDLCTLQPAAVELLLSIQVIVYN
ncbi:OVARIAN TUMOR DOMAIN-containing deubiquitinating enzyme 3 isoform X2 [Cryptomeria japonica]|uniref:OVARIAN TUMOR DOMAIN-containing deubiquitinating enzyme 3 isoform X2 n=1 Tax=Cryptomeria japonica TaxID=3369 RepID=UPI0027DA0E8F|nr:OVARIAN TUMOR DOMAIN-containing deubiquitinating enzyme 3 isoform X2 [Cryptomeria japonica]